MTEPLDLAAIRAEIDDERYCDEDIARALCTEIERLRAANDTLRRVALANEAQVSLLRPVVEAAMVLDGLIETRPSYTRSEPEQNLQRACSAYRRAHANASQEGSNG